MLYLCVIRLFILNYNNLVIKLDYFITYLRNFSVRPIIMIIKSSINITRSGVSKSRVLGFRLPLKCLPFTTLIYHHFNTQS